MSFHTLTSLSDWLGPVNAGSGCLSCVSHVLRGKTHWFPRDAEPLRNCLDGEPEEVCLAAEHSGGITWKDEESHYSPTEFGGDGSSYTNSQTRVWSASGAWSLHDGGEKTSHQTRTLVDGLLGTTTTDIDVTLTSTDCTAALAGGAINLVTTVDGDTTTWTGYLVVGHNDVYGDYHRYRQYSRVGAGGDDGTGYYSIEVFDDNDPPEAPSPWILTYERERTSSGSITHIATFGIDEESETDADEAVDAAQEDADIWGADDEAQFPAAWPWAGLWWTGLWSASPMSPAYMPVSNPASPLLKHTLYGREALRAKIAIADSYYPGQSYAIAWSEIVRSLGYDVARSGTARGRTITTRNRALTVSDLMTAPEDFLGSLDFGDASWEDLGYTIVSISGGFFAADLLKRSRLRFAMRRAGAFTFRIRKEEAEIDDPEAVTITFNNLTTEGTFGDDGLNSTDSIDIAPTDNLKRVTVSVEWAQDEDGHDVSGWLALAQIREGRLGFLQLDHTSVESDSQFYRRLAFTQTSTSSATSIPDPDDPPSEEEQECLDSLPWLDFSQTQVWEKEFTIDDGTAVPWILASATGSGGGATWSNEVSVFDLPAYDAPTEDAGWTVSATSATAETQTSPEDPEELNGAIWANFARVAATSNPYFGGAVLAVTRATSASSPKTYDSGAVEQSSLIYRYPTAVGTSLQIVNVHVAGA